MLDSGFRFRSRIADLISLILAVVAFSPTSRGASDPSLHGRIQTLAGAPLQGATVFIFSAEPKSGTSTFCPTCYVDCTKSNDSDAHGQFEIKSLSPDLLFRVLFVAKGYRPQFLEKVDPTEKALAVTLEPIAFDAFPPDHLLRGKVIDSTHAPICGAVVQAHGIFTSPNVGYWGALRGVDPFAVTDEKGEFTITSRDAFVRMDVKLSARGYANQTVTHLQSGSKIQSMVMTEGATLSGRVTLDGRPMPGISVGVVSVDRGMENYTGHFEIATDDAGRFSFFNLPAETEYYVYGLMESVGKFGAISQKKVRTRANGATTKVGDITIEPAHRLTGRIILADGKKPRAHTRLLVSRDEAWDSVEVEVGADGSFEVRGVPSEVIKLGVRIPGYRISPKNRSFDVLNGNGLQGRVEGDVDGLEMLLEKGAIIRPDTSGFTAADWDALPKYRPLRGAENLDGNR